MYSDRSLAGHEHQVLASPTLNIAFLLEVAARRGHSAPVATLQEFASRQPQISLRNYVTRSLIWEAAVSRKPEMLAAIFAVDPGAVNLDLGHGTYPIVAAMADADMVKLLLTHGADTTSKHKSDPTILAEAVTAGKAQSVEMLLAHGTGIANSCALHAAAEAGNIDMIELLYQRGADLNERSPEIPRRTNGWATELHAGRGRQCILLPLRGIVVPWDG